MMPFGRGSSQDVFTEQLDVRELLRQQKVTVTTPEDNGKVVAEIA